jgi:hypothetical protein
MGHKQEFKRHLASAISYFESAQRQFGKPGDNAAKRAVVDSMLLECERARRVIQQDKAVSEELGLDKDAFLASTKEASTTRHVIEHGRDVNNPRTGKLHSHTTKQGHKIAVHEGGLIFVNPEEIYKGPINLHDLYLYLKSVQQALP